MARPGPLIAEAYLTVTSFKPVLGLALSNICSYTDRGG